MMASGSGYFLRESVDLTFDVKRVSLYLIVPPVLAFIVYFESYLSGVGATRIMTLGQRVMLALWNAAILLSLIAGLQGAGFFSRLFGSSWYRNSLALPAGRMHAFAWPVAVYAVLVSVFYGLTALAILLAMPRPSGFSWLPAVVNCYLPLLWSVAAAALFGMLSRPGASGLLFLATALMGAVTGLPQASGKLPEVVGFVLGVLFPRFGESFLASMELEASGHIEWAVPVHTAALFFVGACLFRLLYRKGRRSRHQSVM
jgi:hypothetical protein